MGSVLFAFLLAACGSDGPSTVAPDVCELVGTVRALQVDLNRLVIALAQNDQNTILELRPILANGDTTMRAMIQNRSSMISADQRNVFVSADLLVGQAASLISDPPVIIDATSIGNLRRAVSMVDELLDQDWPIGTCSN